MIFKGILFFFGLPIIVTLPALAQEVGRDAAMKYFTGEARRPSSLQVTQPLSQPDIQPSRRLSLALGGIVQSKSYGWDVSEPAGWGAEVQYQTSQSFWMSGVSLDYQNYSDGQNQLSKLALLFNISFPRRQSFPIYIGVAAGPGFFFQQRQEESQFSLDYKGYMGLRFLDGQKAFYLEAAAKNHVLVMSDGQFIGWAVSSGMAFLF